MDAGQELLKAVISVMKSGLCAQEPKTNSDRTAPSLSTLFREPRTWTEETRMCYHLNSHVGMKTVLSWKPPTPTKALYAAPVCQKAGHNFILEGVGLAALSYTRKGRVKSRSRLPWSRDGIAKHLQQTHFKQPFSSITFTRIFILPPANCPWKPGKPFPWPCHVPIKLRSLLKWRLSLRVQAAPWGCI